MRMMFSMILGAGLMGSFGAMVYSDQLEIASLDAAPKIAPLPLSEVVLYSSGVGFFQRTGTVDGSTDVNLRFKVDDINDLLKSMVVQDFSGGRVASVSYGSRDPLSKSLKSFAIDLTENPSLGDLLNQVRGEEVEAMRPGPVRGTILGVEYKSKPDERGNAMDVEVLNLLTDEGLESTELSQIRQIRLLNKRVDGELRDALKLLATSHDTQKKSVTIRFDGDGRREVGVAYIKQTPVWKTSYRLVLDDGQAPFLQGWAIVENTSDEDWQNVNLSLVSGRPISFAMDLYEPLYTQRPVVEPELYSSLRPQLYGEAMEDRNSRLARAPAAASMSADSLALAEPESARIRGRRSLGLRGAGSDAVVRAQGQASFGLAKSSMALDFQEGVSAAAEGIETGELFQYVINAPVNLARQQSALLPIVNQPVEGEKVSIYNESVHAKRPLNGFRLKNSTALHLMQGPITVFDGNAYAGDARIDDLAPDQERLISYAIDLGLEVEPQFGAGTEELMSAKIKRGVITIVRKARGKKTYLVRNRDSDSKSVLVEHPLRPGWELIAPKTPTERTRDRYRFLVNIEPDETEELDVVEERQISENVRILNLNDDQIGFYLSVREVSSNVKEVLQSVVAMRNQIRGIASERARREQRITEITQEQARIRENMARLDSSSELFTRFVSKLDEQETELESLRREIENLKNQEAVQQKGLDDYLLEVELD